MASIEPKPPEVGVNESLTRPPLRLVGVEEFPVPETKPTIDLNALLEEAKGFKIDELEAKTSDELWVAGAAVSEYRGRIQQALSDLEFAWRDITAYQIAIAKKSSNRRKAAEEQQN